MKVLLVNTLYPPYRVGGAELFVESLAAGLTDCGNEVVVASTSPPGEDLVFLGASGEEVRNIGLVNLYWPYGDKTAHPVLKPLHHAADSYNPVMERKLAAHISDTKPDFVNTHNLNGFSVAAWRAAHRLGIPVVHTIHDHYLLCPKSTMFRRGENCESRCADCFVYSLPRQLASRSVEAVVGVSSFILDRHLEFGYFGNAKEKLVIPNSCPMPEEPQVRKPKDGTTFGFMGQITPQKGIEVFLRAARNIPEEHRSFVVAGRGKPDYEASLKHEFGLPGIEFIGYAKPEDFYSRVDVLVVPSLLRESFGRVVIEANSYGVPVIGTNRGGVAELVLDGETGFIFDPDEEGSLDAPLRSFLDDRNLAEGMTGACRSRASGFTPQSVSDAYTSLFRRVA